MGRPSECEIWHQKSRLNIIKFKNDVILHTETDESGHVQTNKKDWYPYYATVILGECRETEKSIKVPENALIWTCKISSRGRISAISNNGKTYSNEEVLVIVHVE